MDAKKENNQCVLVSCVINQLTKSDSYPNFIRDLEMQLCNKLISRTSFNFNYNSSEHIKDVLRETGLEMNLKQSLYTLWTQSFEIGTLSRGYYHHPKEQLDYLRKAQAGWERRVSKALNSICSDMNLPLYRRRTTIEQKEFEERWHELGVPDDSSSDVCHLRPVYAPKDFLDTLCSLRSPNMVRFTDRDSARSKSWNCIVLPLKPKSFSEMVSTKYKNVASKKKVFCELASNSFNLLHLGIRDDIVIVQNETQQQITLIEQRMMMAQKVLSVDYAPAAREFVKKGCPQSVRGDIWRQILGLRLTDKERLYYEHLKLCVFETDLMIDRLVIKDVKMTASNDDQYFVFEDYLYQVMLLFSRDREILSHFCVSCATPLKAVIKDKTDGDLIEEVYPPSGIIPFHGFTMLIAPLCFIYDDPILLYYAFRQFYTSYFFRLHTVNSHPQGILQLSLLFERLISERDPQLCQHFQEKQIRPLRIVFKWLTRCFSGYLPTEQILYLWDCILSYDTLEIVAVLAAAIVDFRAPILRHVHSQEDAEAVFTDLASIKVIPLLVHYLSL